VIRFQRVGKTEQEGVEEEQDDGHCRGLYTRNARPTPGSLPGGGVRVASVGKQEVLNSL
jgi:hypothetical protein